MLLIELVLQGVRGFSPGARLTLQPGYNVLVPPEGMESGLRAILDALFFNDGRGSDAALAMGPRARAGLMATGADGRAWRLIRVLGGSGALSQRDAAGQWVEVSRDATEITQILRTSLGLPTKAVFEQLFTIASRQLPSRQAAPLRKAPTPKELVAERVLQPSVLVDKAMGMARARPDSSRAKKDLEVLRAEIVAGKALEEQQYRLEGAQQRLFKLDEKIKQLDALVGQVDVARSALTQMHSLQTLGLPDDALERAAQYDEAFQKLDQGLAKLAEDELQAQERAEAVPPRSLWKDRKLQIGLGAGVLALAAGVMGRSLGAGWLALLDIPAFGVAGLAALRWVGDQQSHESLLRHQRISKDREQKLQAAFDREFGALRAALKILGVAAGKDFVEYFARRSAQIEALQSLEQKLQAARNDPEMKAAVGEREALAAQAREWETAIARTGAGVTRDWQEAERERSELEQTLAGHEPAVSKTPLAALSDPPEPAVTSTKEDPGPRLLELAHDFLVTTSIQTLGASVRERALRYLVALSGRRWGGLEIDGRGQTSVVATGQPIPASRLEEGDLDLLYVALKFALVEICAASHQPLVVVEEAFANFDAARQGLLSQMLKQIGGLTQVVHATALPSHRVHADAVVQG